MNLKKQSQVALDVPPAMSVKFNMMVYDLKRKGVDVTTLSLGEAFFKLPDCSFDALEIEKGYHYSSSLGTPELRERICRYYRDTYGVIASPQKEMLISAGSKAIIFMALLSVVDPGDEVIIIEPAWVSYVEQVKLAYGNPVMVPYHKSIAELESYITEKTKVIIINNPNNPSGKVYSKTELDQLLEIARKHGLYIISDEAYSDFVDEEPFISVGAVDVDKERTFTVNSLSKCFGMSGWRIGYVIASEGIIESMLKLNQHLITCPPTILQDYLARYFDEIVSAVQPQVKEVVQKRKLVAEYMDEIGLTYLPGTATFYFMVSIEESKLDSEEFATKLLNERHVSTVPGIGYGDSVSKFIRVSVGTETMERIERGLDEINSLIKETHG